ncbi:MAG TPA: hypothetical protein VKA49_22655 [Flavitalea sp.]|nr:hypothetical protein [Flavitalea sp.]
MFKSILSLLLAGALYSPARAFYNPPLPPRAHVAESHFSQQIVYADGATKIIDLILETVGLQASFEVRRANVPNAAAVVYQGKRYILYNPSFIAAMNKAAGTPWASVAVLAHEIGHHLNGHTLDGKGSLPAIELEADEFSGFALRKMGASLSEAQVAMRIIAIAKATRTHPARSDRLLAIANGWNHADDQLGGQDVGEIKPRLPEPEPDPAQESLLPAKQIAFDVHFSFDPNTKYHVTVKNNLVKLLNNDLYVLGKLLSTGKSSYPLAFQTVSQDFLLISRTGKIINAQGKTLGYITPRN